MTPLQDQIDEVKLEIETMKTRFKAINLLMFDMKGIQGVPGIKGEKGDRGELPSIELRKPIGCWGRFCGDR
jgi:hypothetical protein